jgi:hypothetical protein
MRRMVGETMIASVDERHIGRGYDPYNSADQPWVLMLTNLKLRLKRCDLTDEQCDALMRKGMRHLFTEENAQLAADIFGMQLDAARRKSSRANPPI